MRQQSSLDPMQLIERMFEVELDFLKSEPKNPQSLARAFHPDVVVHEPLSLPYAGDWRGLEGVGGLLQRMNDVFSHVSVEKLEYSGTSETVYLSCTLHLICRANSVAIEQPFAEILRFKEGLLLEGTPFYYDTSEILSALRKSSN